MVKCHFCRELELETCLFETYRLFFRGCILENRVPSEEEISNGDDALDSGYIGGMCEKSGDYEISNSTRRNESDVLFIHIWKVFLGVGVRVKLPTCVTNAVRKGWPSEDGTYMGYRIK